MLRAKTAYPISSFTWLLIPEKFKDTAKRDAMKGFVKWAITDGQGMRGKSFLRQAAEGSCRKRTESDQQSAVSASVATSSINVPSAGPVAGSRSFLATAAQTATKSRG